MFSEEGDDAARKQQHAVQGGGGGVPGGDGRARALAAGSPARGEWAVVQFFFLMLACLCLIPTEASHCGQRLFPNLLAISPEDYTPSPTK